MEQILENLSKIAICCGFFCDSLVYLVSGVILYFVVMLWLNTQHSLKILGKCPGCLFTFATLKVGANSNLHHFQLMRTHSVWRIAKQKMRSIFHFNLKKQNSKTIAKHLWCQDGAWLGIGSPKNLACPPQKNW